MFYDTSTHSGPFSTSHSHSHLSGANVTISAGAFSRSTDESDMAEGGGGGSDGQEGSGTEGTRDRNGGVSSPDQLAVAILVQMFQVGDISI